MEHAIGTYITLEVVEVKERSCKGCYFEEGGSCIGECWKGNRTDHKNVIYKEIKEEYDMPIGGKEAFLSKVTFRRESKTKQILKDMESIEERAAHYVSVHVCANKQTYIDGATEQKAIDIDKACEWLKVYDITFTETPSMLEDFRKAMEE